MSRKNGDPLVSFVVPTFNSGRDVLLTLASILNQGFRDFEVLMADDGSEPGYVKELEDWVKGYHGPEKVRLIRNPVNRGIIPNIQAAYLEARGKYLKVLSPGDLLYGSHATEKMISCIAKSHIPFVVGTQRAYRVGVSGSVKDEPGFLFPGPRELKIRDHRTAFQVMLRRGFLNGPTFFFEKDFYIQNCWLPEQVRYLSDYAMALLLAWRGFFPEYCDSFFVHYQFGSGITTKGDRNWAIRMGEDYKRLFEWLDSDHAPPPGDPLFRELVRQHLSFRPVRGRIPKKVEQFLRFPLNWLQYSLKFAMTVAMNSSSTRAEKEEAFYRLAAQDGDGFIEMIRNFYENAGTGFLV